VFVSVCKRNWVAEQVGGETKGVYIVGERRKAESVRGWVTLCCAVTAWQRYPDSKLRLKILPMAAVRTIRSYLIGDVD
jgi:hypothetical protein